MISQSGTLGTLADHTSAQAASDLRTALLYIFESKAISRIRVTFSLTRSLRRKRPQKSFSPVSDGSYRPDLDDLAASYTPLLQQKLAAHLSDSSEPFALDDPSLLSGLSKRVRRDDIFPGTKNTSHKDTQKYFGKNAPERLRERAIVHFITFRNH